MAKAWAAPGLLLILLLLASPAFSQNTKGDRPSGNRENRFKIPSKKGKPKKTASNKRIRSRSKSTANTANANVPRRSARGVERPGKPIRPVFSKSKPSTKQKAWRGDIAGKRIRTTESANSAKNVFPQSGRYVRKSVPDRQRSWKGSTGGRVLAGSRTGKTKNVFPQRGRYTNNASSSPKREQAVSNRSQIAKLKRFQSDPSGTPPGKKRKVVPRSASRSFIARRSINVYARFPRPKRKPEQAYTKDLAGKPLRTKNYESPRPGISAPTFKPYYGRDKRVGDRPYTGPAAGKYRSATRPGERAWTGDVAKRRIRHRDRSSKRKIEGTPILSRGYRSATRPGESRPGMALPPKGPGLGTRTIGKAQANVRGKRPAKGGGSVSGKLWNNSGSPLAPRVPASREAAKIGGYSGNLKARRPAKGGGSVSGKLWNNGESPLAPRVPASREAAKMGGYSGNLKAKRPAKGGGSVSGKLWNNREQPIAVRQPRQGMQAASFQGNIRAKRPEKGGGSVSGNLWNNKETPIPVKTPPAKARQEGEFPGKIKRFTIQPGFTDQGEEFTGYIKLPKFRKNYLQNKKAAEESIVKKRPDNAAFKAEGLQVKVARRPYVKNSRAAEESLLKLKPTKSTTQTGELQVKVKQYNYRQNPSSADDALKVREPGKAFARATDYQGNIKMQKFLLFDKNRSLHPDARFVKINKNNVDEERDMLTNFKLWWARLFKKQETQPDHLKDKGRKPRYDKGEEGLWYE